MYGGRGSLLGLVAALALSSPACSAGYDKPYDDGTLGDLGQGFFFVWETFLPHEQDCTGWYGCTGPIDDQRVRPLAVDATVHVGFSAGGCVRAENPAFASSADCGVVRGVVPGTTRLVVTEDGVEVDHTSLSVQQPTTIDVRTPWGDLLETLVSVGFDESLDTVVVLTAGSDLMGVGSFTLDTEPPGCVHADGYGRYFRLQPLCTGRITVTYHAVDFEATDELRLEVREPPQPLDGGPTERDAGEAADGVADGEDADVSDVADAPMPDDVEDLPPDAGEPPETADADSGGDV